MTTNPGPSPGPADDYRLPEVPRRLRRRISALMFLVAVAGGALFIAVITLLSGARWSGGGWIGVTALVAFAVVAVKLTARWMSPSDRAAIDAAQRRVLAPLPRPPGRAAVTVALRPGWVQRRHLAAMPDDVAAAASRIVVDERALSVPGWLVDPGRHAGDDLVEVEWSSVERWRVRAESDGPDLHELTVAGERLTISRLEIVDEVALLDAARSFGAMAIDLEASLG